MLTWKHWVLGALLALLLSIDLGCVAQFRGATAADMAQCRNVARAIARDNFELAAVYNDCMRGKGYSDD